MEAVYTAATGRPPAHILFFDSPLQAEIAGTFLTFNHPGQLLRRDRGRPQVSRVVRESIEAAGPLPPGVADDYGRQLANPVRAALTAAYHAGPDAPTGWSTRASGSPWPPITAIGGLRFPHGRCAATNA